MYTKANWSKKRRTELEEARNRIRAAKEMFEANFDLDGNPITEKGTQLVEKYKYVRFVSVKGREVWSRTLILPKIYVQPKNHREEPQESGSDNPPRPRSWYEMEYVPPEQWGEG